MWMTVDGKNHDRMVFCHLDVDWNAGKIRFDENRLIRWAFDMRIPDEQIIMLMDPAGRIRISASPFCFHSEPFTGPALQGQCAAAWWDEGKNRILVFRILNDGSIGVKTSLAVPRSAETALPELRGVFFGTRIFRMSGDGCLSFHSHKVCLRSPDPHITEGGLRGDPEDAGAERKRSPVLSFGGRALLFEAESRAVEVERMAVTVYVNGRLIGVRNGREIWSLDVRDPSPSVFRWMTDGRWVVLDPHSDPPRIVVGNLDGPISELRLPRVLTAHHPVLRAISSLPGNGIGIACTEGLIRFHPPDRWETLPVLLSFNFVHRARSFWLFAHNGSGPFSEIWIQQRRRGNGRLEVFRIDGCEIADVRGSPGGETIVTVRRIHPSGEGRGDDGTVVFSENGRIADIPVWLSIRETNSPFRPSTFPTTWPDDGTVTPPGMPAVRFGSRPIHNRHPR